MNVLNDAVLLIGGNVGDRLRLVGHATAMIQEHVGSVLYSSSVYETEPWGFVSDSLFLNQALLVQTELDPMQLLDKCQYIESQLGRIRTLSNGHEKCYLSRTMDIDIIFYNSEIIETTRLQVPHPRMHLRNFVLRPLCDIIPDFVHPVFGKTVNQLFQQCDDASDTIKEPTIPLS